MRTALTAATLCFGFQTLLASTGFAQSMSRPEDRVVRAGDTIIFTAPAPHKVRFGGTFAGVTLTPLAQITALFTLTPPLPADGVYTAGQTVTAKVNASPAAGATFQFTCGLHTDEMISNPFTVSAADGPVRTFKIKAAPGTKWVLEKSEVQIDTTP